MNFHRPSLIRAAFTLGAACACISVGVPQTPSVTASTGELSAADRKFVVQAALLSQEEIRLSQLALDRATHPDVRAYATQIISDHSTLNTRLAGIAGARGVIFDANILSAPSGAPESPRLGTAPGMGNSSATTGNTTPSGTSTGRSGGPGTSPAGTTSGAGSAAETPASTTATVTTPAGASDAVNAELRAGLARIAEKEDDLAEEDADDFDAAYLKAMMRGHNRAIDLFRDTGARRGGDGELATFARETVGMLQQHHQRSEELAKSIED